MTSEQIFTTTDLAYLYSLWNNKSISDDVRVDIAYQIDRVEKHNRDKAKQDYTESVVIKNENVADIIER